MLIVSVGSGNSNTDRQITIIDIPNDIGGAVRRVTPQLSQMGKEPF